jgi:hypothetical protein
MKYLKPEVHVIATATNAIEGVSKPFNPILDNITGLMLSTGPAYEADE